jgi:hypothetical protein
LLRSRIIFMQHGVVYQGIISTVGEPHHYCATPRSTPALACPVGEVDF